MIAPTQSESRGAQEETMSVLQGFGQRIAIGSYVGVLMMLAFLTPIALFFCKSSILAAGFLAIEVTLVFLPLGSKNNVWGQKFSAYAMDSYRKWTNFELVYDAGVDNTFEKGEKYVIGYEPHSVLPFALPVFLGSHAPCKDPNLGDSRILATSVVNWCPGIRHMFHWLGGVSAGRQNMHNLLSRGVSVALIPGGVAECGFMGPGIDIAFLRQRYGFIKVALQHGAPLVPIFCFGQNDAYKFLRIGPQFIPEKLYQKIIRKLLFCPMVIWGQYGTPLPFRRKLTMVVGKPIKVPKIGEPSRPEVQHYLDIFIAALLDLHKRHKTSAGYPSTNLEVI